MKPKLSTNLILRIDDDMKTKLAKIQEEVGCPISDIVRQCLNSYIEYYDKNSCVVLPLVVIPKRDLEELKKKLPLNT